MTFDVDAERLGRVRQIGRLHRLRRFADLELDIVVLKTIGGDRMTRNAFDRRAERKCDYYESISA
jgi:hypothetical protein